VPSSFNDLRHAARALVRARAFTAVCVTSLGLGMGIVIAILLFMRAVLGTPPGVQGDGLVELVIRPTGQLRAQAGGAMIDTWSYPDYLDVHHTSGLSITGWSRGEGLFQPPDRSPAVPVPTMHVSSNYFSVLGVGLPLGRGFTEADDAARAEPEAVISYRAWQIRFGSDPDIIGRTITVNRTDFVVVGVAPEEFRGHVGGLNEAYYQLWLPLSHHPRLAGSESARLQRSASWMQVVARLSPGTTAAQADAAVQAAMAALAAEYPATNQEKVGGVEPYFPAGARKRTQIRFAQLKVFGLSGIVLLVVALNISGMMLARGALRERELAIRSAIGATRRRLMQYHLSEALVLAFLGGGLATSLLFVGPVVIAWAFEMWGPGLELFRPDVWVVLQSLALCFVTSLLLGLLPAIRFSRASVLDVLKNDSAGAGRRVGRLQRLTAAAQAGIAVPFLVICGLQFDQARVTALTDVGFEPQGLYAAELNLAAITGSEEERRLFLGAVQENLANVPGVTSASVGDGLPLDFVYRNARVAREGEAMFVTAHTTRVAPGYLETIGTRLLAGRMIDANDRDGAERVVLLSEPLALELYPSGDVIGRRVSIGSTGNEPQAHTVVGITADLVSTQMGSPRPQLFLSLAQNPVSSVLLLARGAPSDASMRGAFDNAIAGGLRLIPGEAARPSTAPGTLFRELITGKGLIENNRRDLLTSSGVGGAAAAAALVLTALGVYGVIAFMVATRTREIGVRVALGASRTRVLRDVLGDALRLVVPGIAFGLLLALAWVRLADPAWYPLGGVEPLVYTLAAATAFLVAVLAGIPSARRAASVQPILAMRAE
jgi:putative ABC transport system permease protein